MAILLAPAGSLDGVTAALDAGADRVYAGLRGWSRGGGRGELDWDELRRAAELAGARGAQIELALNTIPKPRERAALLEQVPRLEALGVRTVIVNDLGILVELRRQFPELSVTASIGCGAQTAADVSFFAELGATAVVLPGTVGPAETRACCAVPGIAVEIMPHMVEEFVLLGRCSMPSYVHLKPTAIRGAPADATRQTGSVKRGGVGACFRICQSPWSVEDRAGRRAELMFPSRQLSRHGDIPAYLAAGVGIFKLQGRSLPPRELALLVARYRQALDAARAGAALPPHPEPVLPSQWTVMGR